MNYRIVSRPRDPLDVAFQGELIHCHCADDAIAIKSANVIITTHIEDRYPSHEIEALAAVLGRYHCAKAAELLRQHNSKTSAAQFVSTTRISGSCGSWEGSAGAASPCT